jgi:16S rRNA A1518/A1519 N6-dimethyltransferase RsmA/KsgA/DIM1 with predicted DNA glycosylase/AP lyase activity
VTNALINAPSFVCSIGQLLLVTNQEWDGLLRVCFTRKNKTIGAAFKATTVLEMLEKNYKTYCALNNIVCLV